MLHPLNENSNNECTVSMDTVFEPQRKKYVYHKLKKQNTVWARTVLSSEETAMAKYMCLRVLTCIHPLVHPVGLCL